MIARLGIGFLRTLARRAKSRPAESIRSVLVTELTRLGDVVVALPVVQLLRTRFPSARLVMLVDNRFVPLVKGLYIDASVIGIQEPGTGVGVMRAVLSARKARVDLAVSVSPARKNSLVTLASGAPIKVGYLTYTHSLTPYLHRTPVEAFGCQINGGLHYGLEHVGVRATKVCAALGIVIPSSLPPLKIREDARAPVIEELLLRQLIPEAPYVVVHPWSGWEFRRWPMDRFSVLVDSIVSSLRYHVVLLYTPEEADALAGIVTRFGGHEYVHFFASEDPLRSAAVIQGAALCVGNDSGPLHLAAALGVPVVGLFGPASPEITGPQIREGTLLYRRLDCSPCNQRRCVRPENPCMHQLEPEDVYQAVADVLAMTPSQTLVGNA